MSSDGQRENDQAGDDEKNSSDKRPRQKKITFQNLSGVSPEEIRRASEKLAMAGEQLREAFPNESFVFPNERFKEIQKQQAVFAHEIAQAHARLAPALQALAHGTNEAQRIGDAIAKGLLTLGADIDAIFPSQDVLAAALAQGYRQAQQSEPAIEDDEQALAFLVAMASTAWEQLKEKGHFLSEAVNPPSEEDFVEAVVTISLVMIGYVADLPSHVVAVMVYYLIIHPQIKDRYKS